MSESESDSYDDYSSTEETEETDQSEPSEKKAKRPSPPPPKKETKTQNKSESNNYDYSSSNESEEDSSYDESPSPQQKTESKKQQIPPKSNKPEQVVNKNKNASPPKKESSEESGSDYSESDVESEDSESSTPEKKAPAPSPKKYSSVKEDTNKSKKSSSVKTTQEENDYSKEEQKESAKSASVTKSDYSDYEYSTSGGPKKVQNKSVKQSTKPSSAKSSSEKKKQKTEETTPKDQQSQVNRRSTAGNSMDLSQPPDFSVPPEVLEEANRKKVDRYGWIQTDKPSSKEKKLLDAELAKEEERSKKWKKMMKKNKWPYYKTRRGFRVVKERTIKGIPNDVRAKAWILLLDDPEDRKPNRGTVQEFFDKGTPSVEHTIRVDIPRTMPNVPEFLKTETREKLYHILRAYSNASGGGGYFQGMGFHAAIYLLYMKDEEKTFWCLYNLMKGEKHKVKDLYENEFSGLKALNSVWEVLLEKKFKHVYAKLKDLMVDPMIYTPSWFLCAFLDLDFPPVLRLKIIDRFIVFGSRQLLSLALAIIDLNQETLSARNAQMDTILPLLQNPTTAETMKDWREIVKKWDKHYLSKKDYSALFKKAGIQEIP